MTETIAVIPSGSPSISRARLLSRFVAVLFALGFLVMLSTAVSGVVFVFYPTTPSGVGHGIGFFNGISVGFKGLSNWSAVGAMVGVELMTIPTVMVLYHLCRMFSSLSKGEVFTARTIGHLRATGWWLTASFFLGIAAVYLLVLFGVTSGLLEVVARAPIEAIPAIALRFQEGIFIGLPIIIATYVMEEARRIAADHAEIV